MARKLGMVTFRTVDGFVPATRLSLYTASAPARGGV